jgi:hypothetical protein
MHNGVETFEQTDDTNMELSIEGVSMVEITERIIADPRNADLVEPTVN